MKEIRLFLANLNLRGVRLFLDNGKLKSRSPDGEINDEERLFIRNNKELIVNFLKNLKSNSRSAKEYSIEKSGLTYGVTSFSQQRLWFIDKLQGGTPEYNMPMVFRVTGTFSLKVLTQVFETILDRHEVLRSVYEAEGGEARQRVREVSALDFSIKEEDLSHLTGEKLAGEIESRVTADIKQAFNLAEDVMLRVCYIKTGGESGVLIFNMHHIASDGWSVDVLTKEFFALYHAYSAGKANPLPGLPIQYIDYAHW
ncbi:condensation domain-containing protein, partial [Pseudoalteromonas sp. OF7H-1]